MGEILQKHEVCIINRNAKNKLFFWIFSQLPLVPSRHVPSIKKEIQNTFNLSTKHFFKLALFQISEHCSDLVGFSKS